VVLQRTDQPDNEVALPERELGDLLAEELRRLDADQPYADALGVYAGVPGLADRRTSRGRWSGWTRWRARDSRPDSVAEAPSERGGRAGARSGAGPARDVAAEAPDADRADSGGASSGAGPPGSARGRVEARSGGSGSGAGPGRVPRGRRPAASA
jgi:hypothetical protein